MDTYEGTIAGHKIRLITKRGDENTADLFWPILEAYHNEFGTLPSPGEKLGYAPNRYLTVRARTYGREEDVLFTRIELDL